MTFEQGLPDDKSQVEEAPGLTSDLHPELNSFHYNFTCNRVGLLSAHYSQQESLLIRSKLLLKLATYSDCVDTRDILTSQLKYIY